MIVTEQLSGQTAIVTGTSSGSGRALAKAFAEEGAAVVCADVIENREKRYSCLQKKEG